MTSHSEFETRAHFSPIIGGATSSANSGDTLSVVDPSTGTQFATVGKGTRDDARRCVELAHQEFETGAWRQASATARGKVLLNIARLLREQASAFVAAEVRNAGHPIGNAEWEVGTAADVFEYFGGAANKHFGDVINVPDGGLDVAIKEPVGVCALIVPWNFPLLITCWKAAPALACGNPIIIKPASLTPISALLLGELLVEAGVPEGAVSVLPGSGRDVGDALVRDPRVSKISFTGETTTGAEILRASSDNITRVSLELGGKSAMVIFDDADMDACVASAPLSVFDNTGQDCCARSRFLVQRSVYDEFVSRFVDETKKLVVGDPFDPATQLGPMISESQRATATDYLAIARGEGATVALEGTSTESGYYLTPCIVSDVDNNSRVSQEEIFGPVASVTPFDTEEDALMMSNASPYGLSGTVWTENLSRAIRVTRGIRTGVISVNTAKSVRTETPFGGFKRSGLGRELGMAAMDHYTETKNIYFSDQ